MKIERRGVTRIVFLTNSYAIKIPNFLNGWHLFLCGLLANLRERKTWKWSQYREGFNKEFDVNSYFGDYNSFSDLLCPVAWASWGGWLLIMKRAETESHLKHCEAEMQRRGDTPAFMYTNWKNNDYADDCKDENFGYYEGRLVKIDYA